MIMTIVSQQIRSLHRRRILGEFVTIFATFTVVAGVIGWSSHNTIEKVYRDATTILTAEGGGAPPNPFDKVPTLSLLSNLAIYVTLIGALLAIVIGHLALGDDRSGGIGRLVFSRPISRARYLTGRMLGAATVVVIALLVSAIMSIAAIRLANGSFPSATDLVKLLGFYALSLPYLMIFVLFGMIAVLLTRRRSLALLIALGAWLVVTFALPQFTSGLRPSSSLNPVTDPVSTSQVFFRITRHLRPISIAEQYKEGAAKLLDTATTTSGPGWQFVTLTVGCVALMGIAWLLIRRHDYAEATSDD